MSERNVKMGTEGVQLEITVDRPSTVEEFLKSGITEESLNQMLIADDSRRIAAYARPLIKEGKNESEIIESCNNYVFVAGRKSSGSAGKAKTQGRVDAISILATLTKNQISTLSSLDVDKQSEIMRLPKDKIGDAIDNA